MNPHFAGRKETHMLYKNEDFVRILNLNLKKITMFGTWTSLSSASMVTKIRRKFLALSLYWHSKEKGISGPFLKYLSTSQWTCRDSFSSLASSVRLPQRKTSILVSVQMNTKKCCAIIFKSKINLTFKKSLK